MSIAAMFAGWEHVTLSATDESFKAIATRLVDISNNWKPIADKDIHTRARFLAEYILFCEYGF